MARRRLTRLRRGPVLWSVVSAALFVLGVLLHVPPLWLGVLLVLPLMITATGLGWRAALPLVPLALALAGLRSMGATDVLELVGLAALLAFASAAGNNLFSLWHDAAREARRNERRARLLGDAALAMARAGDAEALYAAMPPLLAEVLDVPSAELFALDGDRLVSASAHGTSPGAGSVPSAIGRAWRTGEPQYVADLGAEGRASGDAAPTGSELALPLIVRGRVWAVLDVRHTARNAFEEADHRTLEAFVRIAQEVLARLLALGDLERSGAEQARVARLTHQLLRAEGAREAATIALAELVPALGLDAGAVATLRAGKLYSLATHGPLPTELKRMLNVGLPLAPGPSREIWEAGRPLLIRDVATDPRSGPHARAFGARAMGLFPVTEASGDIQALVAVADLQQPRDWSPADRRLLDIAASTLGVVLDRTTLGNQLVALLDGVRGLARAEEPQELYDRVAASAVQLVPGAEAASILIRGPDGFRFQASVGFDLEDLRELGPFSDLDALAWYRDGSDGYHMGVPRIARGADVLALSTSYGGERSTARSEAARIPDIAANICVPISDGGDVVALLNVDSFSEPEAFSASTLRLAEAFAQQVAAIVRQAETLEELRRTAVTDALTGLGNRAGFHQRLEVELGHARRLGHALSIVMLDLDAFKLVNDVHGHHAGDQALVRVSRALAAVARSTDAVFRWGGDEFVLLLPDVAADDAPAVAERFVEAVTATEVNGIRLGASIGIASYPDHGDDPNVLMQRADGMMYHGKARSPRPSRPPDV